MDFVKQNGFRYLPSYWVQCVVWLDMSGDSEGW